MSNWLKSCAGVGLLLSCSTPGLAKDPEAAQVAKDPEAAQVAKDPEAAQVAVKYMAQEIVECAAYFDIVSLALMNSNAAETADEYIKSRKLAVKRADSLSAGVVNERYNSSIKGMTEKIIMANIPKNIADDLSNVVLTDIGVLRDQYGKTCKQVMEKPGDRAEYWMKNTDGASR